MSRIGIAVFFLAIINFAAFAIGALVLGGDAFNGKVENGRYFVMNHGKYTEVSPAAWRYSYSHAISVMVTHPLGIVGGAALVRRGRTKS